MRYLTTLRQMIDEYYQKINHQNIHLENNEVFLRLNVNVSEVKCKRFRNMCLLQRYDSQD